MRLDIRKRHKRLEIKRKKTRIEILKKKLKDLRRKKSRPVP
jgi:hypothetical protein